MLLSGTNPGFIPSMSGRENLAELALAYGINEEGVDEFSSTVQEFAEIGDAIDRNVGGYSTGMKGKLGFGFITALDPEILLIDETLESEIGFLDRRPNQDFETLSKDLELSLFRRIRWDWPKKGQRYFIRSGRIRAFRRN